MGLLGVLVPLHGGGFWLAYAQLCTFYYTCGVLLHHVVPAVIPVKSIQHEKRQSGSVARDALYSLGPLAVKALVWTVVEQLRSRGWGMLYDGPVNSAQHVGFRGFNRHQLMLTLPSPFAALH